MSGPDKPRVLVVDDEPQLCQLLRDALGAGDMDLEVAGSGQEAIDMAHRNAPDLVVADLCLGDCTGLEVIDQVRSFCGEIPAVVITGRGDSASLSEASRRRPIEMFNKPLDLPRLRRTIRQELWRRTKSRRTAQRVRRLRHLAREINIQRKTVNHHLDITCEKLTAAYRTLSGQLALQKSAINYQADLLTARSDDDVFKSLFGLFVHHSGAVFGAAMVCDSNADLQLVGRFGVPGPDNQTFCLALSRPVIDLVLGSPKCTLLDAGDQADNFDPAVRKYLHGLSILAVPLIPSEGQMIGLVLLYRKGEQPFTDSDVALAELVARPTALAVQRNE